MILPGISASIMAKLSDSAGRPRAVSSSFFRIHCLKTNNLRFISVWVHYMRSVCSASLPSRRLQAFHLPADAAIGTMEFDRQRAIAWCPAPLATTHGNAP
jgi:hypothetical protein